MPTPKEFNLLKVIQKIELFLHLTMEEARILLSLSEKKTYEPGKTVFRKGGIPHLLVIVISGQLRLSDVNFMKNETIRRIWERLMELSTRSHVARIGLPLQHSKARLYSHLIY